MIRPSAFRKRSINKKQSCGAHQTHLSNKGGNVDRAFSQTRAPSQRNHVYHSACNLGGKIPGRSSRQTNQTSPSLPRGAPRVGRPAPLRGPPRRSERRLLLRRHRARTPCGRVPTPREREQRVQRRVSSRCSRRIEVKHETAGGFNILFSAKYESSRPAIRPPAA